MKRSGWMALVLTMMSLAAAPAMAERDGTSDGHEKRMEKRIDHLKEKLKLTDDQTVKVKAIMSVTRDRMETARKESNDRMKALQDEADKKINAVLTDDQKKTYAEMKEKRKERKEKRDKKKD